MRMSRREIGDFILLDRAPARGVVRGAPMDGERITGMGVTGLLGRTDFVRGSLQGRLKSKYDRCLDVLRPIARPPRACPVLHTRVLNHQSPQHTPRAACLDFSA
jgi:hypothetical protein